MNTYKYTYIRICSPSKEYKKLLPSQQQFMQQFAYENINLTDHRNGRYKILGRRIKLRIMQ